MFLEQYYNVSQSPDLATFERRLVDIASEMEFPLISGALVVERPAVAAKPLFLPFGNTPEEFIPIAHDVNDGRRSPVNQLLKRLSVPIVYDRELYNSTGTGDIWEKHAPFGYQNGIAVALHLPGHRHFLLGVDRPDRLPNDQKELTRMMADLQLLAVHAQSAAARLLALDENEGVAPNLTPRELEILRWCMEGKGSAVIGDILGLSLNTVNYHLRSIFKKLNVASKHHAVLKALNLGLLN